MSELTAIEVVRNRERAGVLLHPLRLRILEEAQRPVSAAEVARRIGETPQKVNYHVGTLADAGFLRLEGERRKRNLVERRYRATARHYAFSPDVLGSLGPSASGVSGADAFSAARLLGLTALVQEELGAVLRQAAAETATAWADAGSAGAGDGSAPEAAAGEVPTLSLDAEVRFRSAGERARFAEEVQRAVVDVAARYAGGGHDRTYRLVLGCYPVPTDADAPGAPQAGPARSRESPTTQEDEA